MPTLDESIEAATAELSKKAGITPPATESEETETESETETEVTQEETSESETPEGEGDLSEEQILESKNLYKALRGPQGPAIIAALAQQAGILPKSGEPAPTKAETAAARRNIKDIVKDALGPEYSFLQDKIGKIFDEVVTQERAASDERFAEIQQSRVEQEVANAYQKLATETKGVSKQFETRMAALSEEIPIGNMNVSTYMQRLYTIASNERKSSPQKVADQIRRNASDATTRLKTSSAAAQTPEIPTKKMGLDESIRWAQDQIAKGKK